MMICVYFYSSEDTQAMDPDRVVKRLSLMVRQKRQLMLYSFLLSLIYDASVA